MTKLYHNSKTYLHRRRSLRIPNIPPTKNKTESIQNRDSNPKSQTYQCPISTLSLCLHTTIFQPYNLRHDRDPKITYTAYHLHLSRDIKFFHVHPFSHPPYTQPNKTTDETIANEQSKINNRRDAGSDDSVSVTGRRGELAYAPSE